MKIGTRLAAMAIATAAFFVIAFGQSTPPPEDASVGRGRSSAMLAEKELLLAVNQSRREYGMAPLHWSESLADAARRHAAMMAKHGEAEHTFEGEPSLLTRVKQTGVHFGWLSENVTEGPSAQFIHSQFMKSPKHRGNILDTDMNSVGIGVVERGGEYYAVEDFAELH
jgi:uncharacterized protein YkwD